ncbi:flagellar biosynthesis anti-sigma factor FlgM [Pseudomonas sp. PB3P13]
MEIIPQPHMGLPNTSQTKALSPQATDLSGPADAVTSSLPVKPALQQIQSALGELPQVDLERVAAIKAALVNGELATDSASLAAAILTYHRGSDR